MLNVLALTESAVAIALYFGILAASLLGASTAAIAARLRQANGNGTPGPGLSAPASIAFAALALFGGLICIFWSR